MQDLIDRLTELERALQELMPRLNMPQKEQRILEMETQMQSADFWNDNETAQAASQEYNNLKQLYDFWVNLQKNVTETISLIKSNADETEETISFLEQQTLDLETMYQKNRFVLLMSKRYDDRNAIFSIHAGAGGVDAQDWAEMLLRQYLKYCERKNLQTEIIELNKGQDAGIKSVTVEVHGPYAYGLLKSEAGVHRLVRLSPYNPAHTRETSFALLELLPILEEKEYTGLNPDDLKIEATTSSGHGGQSVNTTYSAIRITHIPTGIKVSIQNERSQHQNKEIAMKIIAARVKAVEDEQLLKEKKELRGEFKSAEWGNQIRSYVIHPYKLVKDHRTNYEETEPDKVFNGELDEFVEKYLESQVK